MEFDLINKILFFIVNIIGLYLAFWVMFMNYKKRMNRNFFLFIVFILLWISCGHASYLIHQHHLSLILMKLRFAAVSLFFIAMYFFTIYFPKENEKHLILNKVILVVGMLLFFSSTFTSVVIKNIEFKNWGIEIIFGNGAVLFFGTIFLLTFLIIGLLLRKYYRSSKTERLKIKYFLVGIIIFALFNIIFNVVFPLLLNTYKYYQFGDYSAIFLFSFTAYAITKHELMGIKTLITQVLIVIIFLILILDAFLLSNDLVMQLIKIGILITFLYFSRGMVESVRKEKKARKRLENTYKKIDQYVEDLECVNVKLKEKNEDLGVLLNISEITTGTLDSEKIAQGIVDSVPENLGYLKYTTSFLVLYNAKTDCAYAYFITKSKVLKKIKKLLEKVFGKHSGLVNISAKVDNLIAKTINNKEIQIGDKLEEFINPPVNANICRIIQKLDKAKSYISFPILSSGRVVGVIVFISSKPKKEIMQRDKKILFGFSSNIGSAIENAELYKKTDAQMKELKKLNKNLKRANQKLKELLDMKNEFLHTTSHQLRTPLTAIRGMISMWNDGDFDNLPEMGKKEIVSRIHLSTERLNNITNDMLDSLELEGGFLRFHPRLVNLENIIQETIVTMKNNYDKKGLYIKFNPKKKIGKIIVEPNYIRQVFLNLIDNACKYTREGGVDIDIKREGKYAVVSIKDSGVGLSEGEQKKIFEKFTRGRNAIKEDVTGSGLGLSIAKKIVAKHNGKINFYSEGKGKGSTVKVFLPIKEMAK